MATVEASDFDIDDEHADVLEDVLVEGSTELFTPLDYFSDTARP